MIAWVLAELTLGFVVFCADSVGDDEHGPVERLVRGVLWMVTLTRWFTHRNVPKLSRFGAVVWLMVTTGWLLTLEFDRAPACRELDEILRGLQNELFDLGGELATPADAFRPGMFRVGTAEVKALEQCMDRCQKDLEPLRSFVLPGGGRVSAALHLARTVCRRAERDVLRLMGVENVGEWPLAYLNRLSDLLFVLSRWIGHHLGEKEFLWERPLKREAEERARRDRAARRSDP